MLACMIQIHDLNGAGKVVWDQIPDPFGAIPDDDLLLGAARPALPGFHVEPPAELLGRFNGPGVGGGIGIANGETLLVPTGLGEDTSQLGFACMGRLANRLAFPSFRLFLYYRYPGAIHLDVENGYRLADYNGQIQLDSSLNLLLFSACDIAADPLRRALHRFGGYLQTGQNLHLLAAVIEGCSLTHQRVHAAHSWGKLGILNVHFDIGWELARMTVRA